MPETIEVLVDGGKATPGQPLGPALGPTGINVVQVVQKINEKTKAFAGMKVPVKIIIDGQQDLRDQGRYPSNIRAPVQGDWAWRRDRARRTRPRSATSPWSRRSRYREMKKDSLMGKDQKHRAKEVIGTCVSCGITVEGKEPKDILREIDEGKWDAKFAA